MSKPSCRRLSVAPLAGVERQGRGSLGSGGLAVGISHSLPSGSHLIQGTHPFSSLLPQFHQGQGFGGGSLFSSGERSDKASSSSFSRLLQPSICGDEGLRIVETGDRPFVAEPEDSEDVLQDGDSPVGYVVGPTWRLDGVSRLEGRLFAGSNASGISQVPQVRGVWEGLPVQGSLLWPLHGSTSFHTGHGSGVSISPSGIRLRRYLDDWLIQASSREQVLLALESVLQLCGELGIIVNWEKSHLVPSQRVEYLGVLFDSVTFRASPAQKRVLKLLSIGEEFLSCERQPASAWLGVLASLIQLIPGGRLQMRSLQFCLNRSWDFSDQSLLIRWNADSQVDLQWWLDQPLLESGISLNQISPQLELWSDTSDVGWGAHLGGELTSGLWSLSEQALSINTRELLAVERALLFFAPQVQGSVIALFADNSTAIAYSEFHCPTDSPVGGVSGCHPGSSVHLGAAQCDGGRAFSSQSGLGL